MKVHHFNYTNGKEIETPKLPSSKPHFNPAECETSWEQKNGFVEITIVYEDDIYYVFKTEETIIDFAEALGFEVERAKYYAMEDANGRILDGENGEDIIDGTLADEYEFYTDDLYRYLVEGDFATIEKQPSAVKQQLTKLFKNIAPQGL
jgi:hypothetical protein